MRKLLLLFLITTASFLYAQIPAGYYDAAAGLSGDTLRTVLHTIIRNHNAQTYSSLWTHFQKTDRKPSGTVWDIYSDIPGGTPAYSFTFVTHQCGNYAQEGDCYNREHSVPSSWFGSATPTYTDLFHLYPTDGFVNGKRANYPFGEVSTPSWTSTNGSKLGPMSFPGYSGTVFEPIDAYKGDLARTYFYMAVRYLDVLPGWTSDMFQGDSLTQWTRLLLLKWHYQDTVSQKELDRNDSIYQIQGNRNPFIDHADWVAAIWDNTGIGFNTPSPVPSFSIAAEPMNIIIRNPACESLSIQILSLTGAVMYATTSSERIISINPPTKRGIHIVYVHSPRNFAVEKVFLP